MSTLFCQCQHIPSIIIIFPQICCQALRFLPLPRIAFVLVHQLLSSFESSLPGGLSWSTGLLAQLPLVTLKIDDLLLHWTSIDHWLDTGPPSPPQPSHHLDHRLDHRLGHRLAQPPPGPATVWTTFWTIVWPSHRLDQSAKAGTVKG